MFAPDYFICVECESPCYVFEWEAERLVEAVCEVCGRTAVMGGWRYELLPHRLGTDKRSWRRTVIPPSRLAARTTKEEGSERMTQTATETRENSSQQERTLP